MKISDEEFKKLTKYDTPTIANVIELFEVVAKNRGYMDARIRAAFPELPPMVGFAATASFRADAAPTRSTSYDGFNAQIEQIEQIPGPTIVVFQDLDDPPVAATFGEVMCTIYQQFGSSGLITSGAGRDMLQVKAFNYPVFTGGTICAHGYCHLLHIGVPVRVGGLTVETGDLLHGDANGVVRIPLTIASEVADVASDFLAAEKIILDYIRQPGHKSAKGLSEVREAFMVQILALKERVKCRARAS